MKQKKTILAAILLTLAMVTILGTGCGEKKPPEGTVDADRYQMDLKLDTEQKSLSGTVEMAFTNHTDQPLSEIVIRNYAASILEELGKGNAEIETITGPDGNRLKFTAGNDPSVVTVDLGENSLQPDEDSKVTVQYRTDVPKVRDRFGYYTEGEDQYYNLTFCFPVLSVFENGAWNQSPYVFDGESVYTKVSDYSVRFEAPETFTAAASGRERADGGLTVIEAENIRDLAIVASNNMEVSTEIAEGVRINHYTMKHPDYPWMDHHNDRLLEAAKDSVTLFTKAFGKYPYEELDVIQSFISNGMEYPGLILIGLPDVNSEHGLLKGMEERGGVALHECLLVAHETAHQWFYAAVGNDPYQEPWLDESFANYCELGIYGLSRPESMKKTLEETDAEGEYFWRSKEEQRKKLSQIDDVTINKPYRAYEGDDYGYGYIVYERGADFLFELQDAMGDETFFAMMQDYYSTYRLKEATGEDFAEMVYRHDDSEKVKDVLQRYLE